MVEGTSGDDNAADSIVVRVSYQCKRIAWVDCYSLRTCEHGQRARAICKPPRAAAGNSGDQSWGIK